MKEAQKLLEMHVPQYQQWKEEAKRKGRAVELQEQAEATLGELIARHGGGAAIPSVKEARSGLVFQIARKQ